MERTFRRLLRVDRNTASAYLGRQSRDVLYAIHDELIDELVDADLCDAPRSPLTVLGLALCRYHLRQRALT